jgi:hypothetical protein
MAFYPVQAQDFALDGAGCSATATSLILTSMLKIDGTAFTMATDFGAIGYGVHEPDTSVEENVSFTGLTNNANGTTTLTGVTRGLRFNTPYTQDTALRQPHAGGSIFRLSNTAPFYNEFVTKLNNETIDGVKTHTASPIVPTPTTDYQAATKKYVDDIAIAGAPDASTTVKGIVEAATSAELAAGTATGATGALLAATGASFNATSSAAVIVPVTKTSGKIDASFGGAASSLATLNGSSKVVEDPANAQTTSGVGKIPLGKAVTGKIDESFQQTTDANVTTLTGAGDASSLHYHVDYETKVGVRANNVVPLYEAYAFPLNVVSFFTASNNTLTTYGSFLTSVPTGDVGNSAYISTPILPFRTTSMNFADLTVGKKLIVEFVGRMAGLTADQTGSFGLTSAVPTFGLTSSSLLFGFSGGSLYATSGEGGAVTQSSAIDLTGITITNMNIFRIVYVRGTDAKFYINGVLKATITTNLPVGANSVGFGWYSDGNTNSCYFRELAGLNAALER